MTERRTPLDVALDLLVYAPVGLALAVGEELPRLAAKGRSRLGSRLSAARLVGELAVAQGRREVDRRLGSPPAGSTRAAPPRPTLLRPTVAVAPPIPPGGGSARPVPEAQALAIPGYDSLSASQVVQRLAGLSSEDLDAVRAYEASHRGRRTILARVAQLQA